MAAISAIDRMEQEYLHEYYLLKEKDKNAGKDLNKVAHDEMVRMQHHFSMLRKIEKQNFAEMMARKKREETLTVAPVSESMTTELSDPAESPVKQEKAAASKRLEIIAQQMRRSKLER